MNIIYLKNLLKSLLISIVLFLVFTLIVTILNYFNLLSINGMNISKIIINLVEFYEEYSPTYFKNFVVFGNKQIDRSPCGTGTSAKLAQLYYYKKIGINEDIIVESIIGTKFIGRIIDYRENHGYNLIIPIIEGNAFIIGYNNYVISNLDKIKSGFIL